MSAKFDDLLIALEDAGRPFPVERLSDLSDLDRERMQRLRAMWPRIADDRRRDLMTALGQLADDHIEFTFERINRFAIDDPLAEIRAQAIRNLWECEDPRLVGPLLTALAGDSHLEVRAAAGTALGAFLFLGETEALPSGVLPRIEEGLLAAATSDSADEVRRQALRSTALAPASYANAELSTGPLRHAVSTSALASMRLCTRSRSLVPMGGSRTAT